MLKRKLTVYSGGTFDMIHRGHLDLLKWCRLIAGKNGKVVISLNTDGFVERFKGKRPVVPLEDRRALLEAFKDLVDVVIENIGDEDSKISILKVKPDIIVVGSDWLKKDYCKQMSFTPEWLEEQNIALCYIPRNLPESTTNIKNRVKE